MSLEELLTTLEDNKMLYIEITETIEDKEIGIIGFEAPGWEALNPELLARTVDKISVETMNIVANIRIHLTDN